jgi:hypothetical protein
MSANKESNGRASISASSSVLRNNGKYKSRKYKTRAVGILRKIDFLSAPESIFFSKIFNRKACEANFTGFDKTN